MPPPLSPTAIAISSKETETLVPIAYATARLA